MSVELTIFKCQIPLTRPYHLAFTEIKHFDSFFCRLQKDNDEYWSETTALPGYSWETPESIWDNINSWIGSETMQDLKWNLKHGAVRNPFAATCISTAIEKSNSALIPKAVKIPLVGIISSADNSEIEQQLSSQIDSGFTTIKVKVQGNLAVDLPKLEFIQSVLPAGINIRIDANQSYVLNDAIQLVSILNSDKVELFEQPFQPNQWDEMVELKKESPVPLMLDESIWTEEHILKTIELDCAEYVKLKLFKHGSVNETKRLINLSQNSDLKVVFGNGVQSNIGCYDEAILFSELNLSTVGELNGYLKQSAIVNNNLKFESGILSTVENPTYSESQIKEFTLDSKTVELKLS